MPRKTPTKKKQKQNEAKEDSVQQETTQDLMEMEVSYFVEKYWADLIVFDSGIVETIYRIFISKFDIYDAHSQLEMSGYFEKYLLPNLNSKATWFHIVSMMAVLNEKFRSGAADPFRYLLDDPEKLKLFFDLAKSVDIQDCNGKRIAVVFWINSFSVLEIEALRTHCLSLVRIHIWRNLNESRLNEELEKYPHLKKSWSKSQKKASEVDVNWLFNMCAFFVSTLATIEEDTIYEKKEEIMYLERVVEFLIDLLCQMPIRMYVNTFLDDLQIVPIALNSKLYASKVQGQLFRQLVDLLRFYAQYPIDDQTGDLLDPKAVIDLHYEKMGLFQKVIFANDNLRSKLLDFCVANISRINAKEVITENLKLLSLEELVCLCELLKLRATSFVSSDEVHSKQFLISFVCYRFARRKTRQEELEDMLLYPQEELMWSRSLLKTEFWRGYHCLPFQKQNLQYLCMDDYLHRTYHLLRLECNNDVRKDIEDALLRLQPRVSTNKENNYTEFTGWSRMAVPLETFELVTIQKPNIGENNPAKVIADVHFNVSKYNKVIQQEWDAVRSKDVMFLVSIKVPSYVGKLAWKEVADGLNEDGKTFMEFMGIQFVRGCEVMGYVSTDGRLVMDESGKPLIEGERTSHYVSFDRTLRVCLDTAQYQEDIRRMSNNSKSVYDTFNLLVRRKSNENNFKAVLDTIKQMMFSGESFVPDWLQNIILGYGDPLSAHYTQMVSYEEEVMHRQLKVAGGSGKLTDEIKKKFRTINFQDTFLNFQHLKESFPSSKITIIKPTTEEEHKRKLISSIEKNMGIEQPEQLKAPDELSPPYSIEFVKHNDSEELIVSSYVTEYKGPFTKTSRSHNTIKFTPKQSEAIRAGCSTGLTLIVGPPGTGKTDVAVQIISNIYRTNPDQHTLLITHSNQALNQIFEKLVKLDIEQRHLLRLGHGEEDLELEAGHEFGFGKYGRIQWFLERKTKLLEQVNALALNLPRFYGDVGSSCDAATSFFDCQLCAMWYTFSKEWLVDNPPSQSTEELKKAFPFLTFFQAAPKLTELEKPLISESATFEEAIAIVNGCWKYLEEVFAEIRDLQSFEILKSNYDRSNFLLTKEAKIIAMTCTHAAIKRQELIDLRFKYDNIVMEEAGQIMEIETFIPLVLQSSDDMDKTSRLKRLVLIGDHNQLPPIVKNMALQKYSHLDQSMFSRLIRLGVPYIQLEAQGRCRKSIRELFSWKYDILNDLPIITTDPKYSLANPGFNYPFQLVNVENFMGRGESSPNPHFMQNLGEAEYVVAVYQYMRLLGYPANSISILTTYNGQRELILDVLKTRCGWTSYFGMPGKVSTVDKYQGRQNEYVLLSLVRTNSVGHLRDVRRLIVAMSRSKFGLYVFCRKSVMMACPDIAHVFERLSRTSNDCLSIVHGESYLDLNEGKARKEEEACGDEKTRLVTGVEDMGHIVYGMAQRLFEAQGK